MRTLPRWIFMSRWLQAPLYIGLIVAQGIYVWQFWKELVHLISMMTIDKTVTETELMLIVLGLIDVVMISNLLVMVIVAPTLIRAEPKSIKTGFPRLSIRMLSGLMSRCRRFLA